MEDVTNQVEIIFHPQSSEIDPLDPSAIQLNAVGSSDAALSRSSFADGYFKVPTVPLRIPREASGVQDERAPGTTSGSNDIETDMDHGDDDDEWEETLIYVDLDDIPNVQELFACDPDDFLLSQTKRNREEKPKVTKPTHSKINLKFYNLDEDHPILQIGDRFYMGKYEEPFGTNLFFREKVDEDLDLQDDEPSQPDRDPLRDTVDHPPPKTVLTSLIPEPDPPLNPVFGIHKYCTTDYELVAKVHKVLRMTRRNVIRREKEEPPAEMEANIPNAADTSIIRTTTHGHGVSYTNADMTGAETVTADDITDLPAVKKEFIPRRTVDLAFGSRKSSWRTNKRQNLFIKGEGSGDMEGHERDVNSEEDDNE